MDTRFRLVSSLVLWALSLSSVASEPTSVTAEARATEGVPFSWRDGRVYQRPDFDAYFPDSQPGALILNERWSKGDLDAMTNPEGLALVRQGLRRFPGDRTPLLRWVGSTFIWGKVVQDPEAIEIMYHASMGTASATDTYGTRSAALYFGLSVVRPKTDAILRTLVEICMEIDGPNDLSRVAWGLGEQRESSIRFLAPYAQDPEPVVREKADVVRKILRRELKAFAWAAEKELATAEERYGGRLKALTMTLRTGDSSERLAVLNLIEEAHIARIMNEAHISTFYLCSLDKDPEVRKKVARIVGTRWVWAAPKQDPAAIDLLLAMTEDTDREVRYNAVYFGLSTVKYKKTDVLRRLLEIAFKDREEAMYNRIVWSLRGHQEETRVLLDQYASCAMPVLAEGAREVYADMVNTL